MTMRGLLKGSVVVGLALILTGAALGQDDIDFGDDTSRWANDGQCDDPRFDGEGAASFQISADLGRDASDCRAAFEAGTVTLIAEEPEPDGDADAARDEVDYGDDSGAWANDGECDDPRFVGEGMAAFPNASHLRADANDCREAVQAGTVTFSGEFEDVPDPLVDPIVPPVGDTSEIEFGDDSGNWANDGECDDPRFGGGFDSHILADATDCREAFEAGEVEYVGEMEPTPPSDPIVFDGIEFGTDSGGFANDAECDDPRFTGTGASSGFSSHLLADASDCLAAYQEGTVTLVEGGSAEDADRINFGDDSGSFANDGECDDPRFTGPGASSGFESNRLMDATDCRQAYESGTVQYVEPGDDFRINFGDDSSATASDGVCDDPRFQGRGAAERLLSANRLADASDCRAAYDAGTVTYDP
jgi:hypothetical protein